MSAPAYVAQDKARDPSGVRTMWILQKLLIRPYRSSELKQMAETNGLGYAPATYTKDLTGLEARNLVYSTMKGGTYHLHQNGVLYLQARGIGT